MPSSEHQNLDQLDYPALRDFIDTDISTFIEKLDAIRSKDAVPPSLYDVQSRSQVLAIGPMANDDETGGKSICDNAKKAATAIDEVFNHHKAAFTKLKDELLNVITTMKDAQEKNLTQIKSAKFMDAIGDYQTALGGGTGNGTGNGQNSLGL